MWMCCLLLLTLVLNMKSLLVKPTMPYVHPPLLSLSSGITVCVRPIPANLNRMSRKIYIKVYICNKIFLFVLLFMFRLNDTLFMMTNKSQQVIFLEKPYDNNSFLRSVTCKTGPAR